MFYDQASIEVFAGKGGDGAMSFRRESLVPHGGPDGGNGGRGGDVILVVQKRMNTLMAFQHKRRFIADDGRNGGGKNMTGRSAKPTYIEVPPGTIVRDADTNVVLGDLTREDQQLIVAKGGRGGRGNQMFATPTNQAPRIAENGAPGETRSLALELKLIADIGLVGKPNAGKSTLLSVLTAAKPKIADYPFTTLQPNLGVAEVGGGRTVVLADIPGLIEGASQGVGLGHEFLRHIERTRVLIHLIDGLAEDPIADFKTINAELAAFGHGLAEKPQLVALTKMDLPDARAAYELFASGLKKANDERQPANDEGWMSGDEPSTIYALSSATTADARELLYAAVQVLDALPPPPQEEIELVIENVMNHEPTFEVLREPDGFRVISSMLERKVQMTRWDLDDSVLAFQRTLERSGIGPALESRGVKSGDIIRIGEYEMEWGE
jgi:GTP-binding protein